MLVVIVLLSLALMMLDDEQGQQPPRLSALEQDSISRIAIIRKELEDFSFSKQNGNWFMQAPLQYEANDARINAMLRLLNVESHGQLAPETVELRRLGLADPAVVMRLDEHEFKFGSTDAINRRRYVLFDNTIHLVDDLLYRQLTATAAAFAKHKLLPENFTINSITFPEHAVTLTDGQWHTQTPVDIDPDRLKRLVYNWNQATALSVNRLSEPEQVLTVKLTSADREAITFLIISTTPHLILGRKDLGLQYHLGGDEAEKLLLEENPGAENNRVE